MKTNVILFLMLALSSSSQAASSGSPPQSASDAIQPSVVIESVLVDGHAENFSGQPGPTMSITVPEGPRRVEIHYTATNLASPDRARFRFQLQGLDRDWVDAGNSRSVSYRVLPAGHYRFKVDVADPNGIWNEGGGTLNITVESFGLQFKIVMVAILLLAIFGFFCLLIFRRGRHNGPMGSARDLCPVSSPQTANRVLATVQDFGVRARGFSSLHPIEWLNLGQFIEENDGMGNGDFDQVWG
jgi:hypothetical protein